MARQIGARLKKLREVSRLSLDYAAKSVGISKQTLFKYENDKITNIPSDKIKDLARLYQTSPAYIMGWEDDPSVKKEVDENHAPTVPSLPEPPPNPLNFNTALGANDAAKALTVADEAFSPRIRKGDTAFVTSLYKDENLIPNRSILAIQAVDQNGVKTPDNIVLRFFYYTPDFKGIMIYAPSYVPEVFPPVFYPFEYLDSETPVIGIVRSVSFNVF